MTLFFSFSVLSVMSHPMTNSGWVNLHSFSLQGGSSLTMSYPFTNSQWVTLHFQVVSWIMFHLMTNRQSVTLHFCLVSSIMFWPKGGGWYCIFFLCQSISSIMSHPMTNREWVTLQFFFSKQLHQSWGQQSVSDTTFTFLCQAVSSIPWPTVSQWHYFFPNSQQ